MAWHHDCETQIFTLDTHHQELSHRTDRLNRALEKGEASQEFSELFNFIAKNVYEHFEEEEYWHSELRFPSAILHREIHDQFRASLSKMRTLQENESPEGFIRLVRYSLLDWLSVHATQDQIFAMYVKEHLQLKK